MSTTDSIVFSRTKQSPWHEPNTIWTLGLSGTVVGAGALLFSIRVGFGGSVPILIMLVLAHPIAFYYYRALARLCLSGSNPSDNITETVEKHLSKTGGVAITSLYFFTICPLLWTYSVTITNTSTTFWENQLQMSVPNRSSVVLFLLLLVVFVTWSNEDLMVKVISHLVWPFAANLMLISSSLILYWNSTVIDQIDISNIALTGCDGILVTVWLGISIMMLSFSFSPIVSSLVVSKREEYERGYGCEFTEQKCLKIISHASMLMITVVMPFAFSCLFTLSPINVADAKTQNIPVLSYLMNHFVSLSGTKSTFAIILEYGASIIALAAIFGPSPGHYLGTLEGLNGLALKFGYKGSKTKVSAGKLNIISMIPIMGSTWVVAYVSSSTLNLIEAMGTPIIASLPRLLPMYVIRKASSLAKYRGRLSNVLVTVIGLSIILNIAYKLF